MHGFNTTNAAAHIGASGTRLNGKFNQSSHTHKHTHTRLTALILGLPGWAGTREVKPIWILLKQETVSGSGISWATCKSASRSRQITMPVPHHSITWLILTNKTVQENTDTQTQYKSEKVNNLKYSKTKLAWFSCLLQHSARKRGGLILQRSRAHTGPHARHFAAIYHASQPLLAWQAPADKNKRTMLEQSYGVHTNAHSD